MKHTVCVSMMPALGSCCVWKRRKDPLGYKCVYSLNRHWDMRTTIQSKRHLSYSSSSSSFFVLEITTTFYICLCLNIWYTTFASRSLWIILCSWLKQKQLSFICLTKWDLIWNYITEMFLNSLIGIICNFSNGWK